MTNTTTAPVIRAAWVARTPEDAFCIFTSEIGAWWPLPTHRLFGEQSGGVFFRDGKLIEQSIDGSQTTWATVTAWDPPNRLEVQWYPGSDESSASEVEVSFIAESSGTKVIVEHRGWEAFGADGMRRRHRYVGPNAWGYVLDHFADTADTQPNTSNAERLPRNCASERNPLRERCEPGPRSARQVHRGRRRYGHTDRARSRRCPPGRHRPGPPHSEQRETAVHCHLFHYGETMVDQPMPWEMIVNTTQASRHLPGPH